tara:strand:- start:2904 stop:3194 length:291 start_codon:yes stop_codon:yes gene_type:complete
MPRSQAQIKAQRKYFQKRYYEDPEFRTQLKERAKKYYYDNKDKVKFKKKQHERAMEFYEKNKDLVLEMNKIKDIESKYGINIYDVYENLNIDEPED